MRQLTPPGVSLRFDLGAKLDGVCLQPGLLEQALPVLLVNAVEAMPEGGEILVETSTSAEGAPGSGAPGPFVVLSVRDSGSGMGPEVLDRLFEPFFTTSRSPRGRGLGLSSVYGMVTRSGGHLDVESTPGEGSLFRLYFPVRRA